jgi:hypothetical protein
MNAVLGGPASRDLSRTCAPHGAPCSHELTRKENPVSKVPLKPFLIARDDSGDFRLTVRDTRYNSQGYPIVTQKLQDESFKTAAAARAHARTNFGAEAGQFASK